MVSECQLRRRRPKTYWIDELVMAYQDNPSEERFAAILAAMRQAILAVTQRLGLRDPQLIDEAISDGWKGLWIAAQRWDRTRGGFAAYGTLVIMRKIIVGLRERTFINKESTITNEELKARRSLMFDMGPDMESATVLCCREAASAEFILLVAPAWQNRLPVVLAVLEDAGATVTAVDLECAIMRGRVQTDRLDVLTGLPQVTAVGWRGLANPKA